MKRPWWYVALAVTLASTAACDDEAGVPGQRGPCAGSAGAFVDCEDAPIETAEDACWRLVECGVIPLEQNDPDRQWVTDWAVCVEELQELSPDQERFVLACIEAASCADLQLTNPGGEPLCFDFGQIEQ